MVNVLKYILFKQNSRGPTTNLCLTFKLQRTPLNNKGLPLAQKQWFSTRYDFTPQRTFGNV